MVDVRPLTHDDIPYCAELASLSSGRSATELAAAYDSLLAKPDHGHLVGAFDDDNTLLGFARTVSLHESDVDTARPVPAGWYLLGLNVAPSHRRKGIATSLTAARLQWLNGRTHEVFYTARRDNHASIALHKRFGFTRLGNGYLMKPNVDNLTLFRLQLS
jgi:aminoglycoside 6'-N-acetyltransferase I